MTGTAPPFDTFDPISLASDEFTVPVEASPAAENADVPEAQPKPPKRIVLTGFMGAGKTTVGDLLAKRLAWRFADADAVIEEATGATIAQLFAERGEPWFRQVEYETVQGLLGSDSLVLALGGGAIEDSRTRELLLSSAETRLIHLEASLETVLKRCEGTESLRPVLQNRPLLEDRYQLRLPLYRESHLSIPVDSLPPGAIVEVIVKTLAL
jgi:shikimate kinase